MATDLFDELGGTFDGGYAASAMRPSKWEKPKKKDPMDEYTVDDLGHESTALTVDDLDDNFLRMRDEVRQEIQKIVGHNTEVKNLSNKYRLASAHQYQTIIVQMETVVQTNTAVTTQIKWRVQKERTVLASTADNVNSLKIKEFNALVHQFKAACNMFGQSLNQFDKAVKSEQLRQLDIVDVDHTLSAQEKRNLVESEDPKAVQQFLSQRYALTDATNDQLLDRLTDLEKQNDGMKKIERSIHELHELFNELNILIIEQQDLIDSIDQNVVDTKDNVTSGTKHLGKAEQHQKQTRKMMLIGVICCLVILVIIIIAVVPKKK